MSSEAPPTWEQFDALYARIDRDEAALAVARERAEKAEQERDAEAELFNGAQAALAVAREREQRAVEALREAEYSQCGWAGGCPVCAETPDEWAPNRGHRRNCKLGAALVDEPAADRAEPREGMVTVYDFHGRYVGCMGAETWQRLLVDEPAAATLAEPEHVEGEPAHDHRVATSSGSASAAADEPTAGTRAFPHDFEGDGKRCLACGEPRWMHPSGSLVRFGSAAADEPGETP